MYRHVRRTALSHLPSVYTFTAADAQAGKVTFQAEAILYGGPDIAPTDNTAIALPTKVSGSLAAAAIGETAVEDGLLYLPALAGGE